MSFWRIQSADTDPTLLLDPEHQQSLGWDGRDEDVRDGVSVCGSVEDLARYFAATGGDLTGDRILVEITGHRSTDRPVDAELGEHLIHPDAILSVARLDDVDAFWTIYDTACTEIWGV